MAQPGSRARRVLARLSWRCIAPCTWLEQILIENDDLTIIGSAPSAAEVTRLLSVLPAIMDIEFGSPVTRDNTQNIERFRINAKLTGQLYE